MAEKKFKLKPLAKMSQFRKILNLVGIIFLTLVALEVVLRLLGVLASQQWNPGQKVQSDSEFSILCVGDSWTVGEIPGNYPDYLFRFLKQKYEQKNIAVYNLGRPGGNSSQCLNKLLKSLERHSPRVVIVLTGNNDHWNLADSQYWHFARDKYNRKNIFKAKVRIFLHSLRILKLYKTIYYKFTGRPTLNQFFYRTPDKMAQKAPPANIDRETHRRQLIYNLTKFVELSRLNNFNLVFMTYFHFHGYHVNEIIRDVALSFKVPLVDSNFLFHKEINSENRRKYFIPDGHPNERGYEFIARKIFNLIVRQELL